MWPWGHAAVGYFTLWVLTVGWRRSRPNRAETVVVLAATQLPDAIDKPLAWTFSVLPTGRSLGHSLFTAALLVGVVSYLATRYDRRGLVVPFGVGYVTAILTDAPASLLGGDFSRATFLLWPLLPSPEYTTEPSFVAHLSTIQLDSAMLFELGLVLLALVVWQLSVRLPRPG